MWYAVRFSSGSDPDWVAALTDLLQITFRDLVFASTGVYLAWYFLATGELSARLVVAFFPITVAVVLISALSLWLARRRLVLAQGMWQLGVALLITLGVWTCRQPEVAFSYALLPLLASVTVGWPAGLAAEGLVFGLIGGLSRAGLVPPLGDPYSMAILAGGAFAGLLGWAASRVMLTAVQWSMYSSAQAEQKIAEARQHRGEAVRVLKDLDQAYYRLEQANHMLVLARADAEEAREARNQFALAVSHELRTPLNFIIGFSELMVNSPDTYAELEQWPDGLYDDIGEIYRSSEHLLRLVNDVLDLGQIEALRMTLVKEWVQPAQIVEEVAAMVQSSFVRRRLQLRTETDAELPEVFVDRTRVRQILLNLVANSLRATERGEVSIRARRDGESVLFCVQDTGPGIAPESIPRLFEEFRQVGEGSWRRREGSGLGIPISKRFVELHGGRLWVESELGEGTAVYFILPLPETSAAPSRETQAGNSDEAFWQFRMRRAMSGTALLVLSPDPAAGDVVARHVGHHNVVAVQSPDQVCATVAELLPTMLIVDHAVSDQPQVQALLRNLPYDLPVVSLALPGSPSRPSRLPEGASGYLVKPVARRDLMESVRAFGPQIHRLLIVDDDPGMVRFATLALQSTEGSWPGSNAYQLSSASTGCEALAKARDERPNLIFLDLALPDISGWQVLEELQQDPELAAVPVVLVTAYDWPQDTPPDGQDVLRVTMHRPLSRRELTAVLGCLIDTVRPEVPAAPIEPAHPGGRAA